MGILGIDYGNTKMPITFLYNNLIDQATSIKESTVISQYGTSYVHDGDLNSAYRGTSGNGTSTLLFDFGSAVYMDSICCISNLTTTGTLVLRAGATSSVGDQVFSIPIDGLGTSHKFFGNFAYQYWRVDLFGQTGILKHQINELFLGKRLSIVEMPSYPLENSIEENTTELTSERGQKWVYSNYERENWILNFEGVNRTTENNLYNMYRFVRKNTQPFFMALDSDNNPNEIKYVRFKDNAFMSDEITKNVFDISLEIEKEV